MRVDSGDRPTIRQVSGIGGHRRVSKAVAAIAVGLVVAVSGGALSATATAAPIPGATTTTTAPAPGVAPTTLPTVAPIAPLTIAPLTIAPVTIAPATLAPVTVAPITTVPIPTIAAPTTTAAAPTTTTEPSTVAIAPVAQSASIAPPATVNWLSDRRVALWVDSPSMSTKIQVQVLLARDWNSNPSATFPSIWMLDGMRATDQENGWTVETDAAAYFADQNVNVILPVGGQSSFYSDWVGQDNGKNYQWETFLTKELPPILERDWRTSQTRAVAGLSMGGTAAIALAARNPGFFTFASSFSGILTTSTAGMPQAIAMAMKDAGGFDATAMWGAPPNDIWAEHDPYMLAPKLKGVGLYVSSGSGLVGPYDQPSGIPGVSTNLAGMGLEILARMTSQTFARKLNQLGIPATINYRPTGTHSWPYWQFELHQAWPLMAQALGVAVGKPGCGTGGAIASVANNATWLGECLTSEYGVAGGRAQDFRSGRVFYSGATGAQTVGGVIGGLYGGYRGPDGVLGFPKTGELGTPDGRGRFNAFTGGMIYWSPTTGAHAVRGAVLGEWSRQRYESGRLGYPTSEEFAVPGGVQQNFQNGFITFKDGKAVASP